MRALIPVFLVLAAAGLAIGCGGSTEADSEARTPGRSTGGSAPEGGAGGGGAVENPWNLGYRFQGTPGTKFHVKRSMTSVLGVMDDGSKHVVGENPVTILLHQDIKGVSLQARIESRGEGDLELEVVTCRILDPRDPLGGSEVGEVLDTGKASGFKGTVVLSGGEPVPEK